MIQNVDYGPGLNGDNLFCFWSQQVRRFARNYGSSFSLLSENLACQVCPAF